MANCQETRRIFCIGVQLLTSQRLVPFFTWNSSSQGLTKETLGNCPSCMKKQTVEHSACYFITTAGQPWNCSSKCEIALARCMHLLQKKGLQRLQHSQTFIKKKTGQLTLPLPSRRVFTWNQTPIGMVWQYSNHACIAHLPAFSAFGWLWDIVYKMYVNIITFIPWTMKALWTQMVPKKVLNLLNHTPNASWDGIWLLFGMHHLKYWRVCLNMGPLAKFDGFFRNCPPLNGQTVWWLICFQTHKIIIIGYISHSTAKSPLLHGDEIPLQLVGEIRIPT